MILLTPLPQDRYQNFPRYRIDAENSSREGRNGRKAANGFEDYELDFLGALCVRLCRCA